MLCVNGSSSTESGVFSAYTKAEFPEVGSSDIIYKASSEKNLYQFNVDTNEYEPLCKFETDENDTKIIDAVKVSENTLNAKINDKADTSALTELSNKVGTVEDTANSAIQEVRVDAATGLVAEADANDATVINIKFLEDVVFVMDDGTAGDIIAANSAE